MTRWLLIFAIVVFTLVAAYLGWARHRLSYDVLAYDDAWPRAFPYPDEWLERFALWIDKHRPAPPGNIKMAGELYAVRSAVESGLYGSIVIVAGLTTLLIASIVRRRHPDQCRHCGYSLRGRERSLACPECGRTNQQAIDQLTEEQTLIAAALNAAGEHPLDQPEPPDR